MQADGITSAKAREQEREARGLEFAGEVGARRRAQLRRHIGSPEG